MRKTDRLWEIIADDDGHVLIITETWKGKMDGAAEVGKSGESRCIISPTGTCSKDDTRQVMNHS